MLTGRGQLDAGMAALEEAATKTVFHRLDPRADGRLGDIQILGGAVEISAVGNFEKSADVVDFHADLRS